MRDLVVVRKKFPYLLLDGHKQPDVARHEIDRSYALIQPRLAGVHAQVRDERPGEAET